MAKPRKQVCAWCPTVITHVHAITMMVGGEPCYTERVCDACFESCLAELMRQRGVDRPTALKMVQSATGPPRSHGHDRRRHVT